MNNQFVVINNKPSIKRQNYLKKELQNYRTRLEKIKGKSKKLLESIQSSSLSSLSQNNSSTLLHKVRDLAFGKKL